MLRTKIFDGFAASALESYGADEEFIFGGDGNAKFLAVAGHIENGGANYGGLADYANAGGALGEEEGFYFVIFLDDAAVFRTCDGLQLDGGVEAIDWACVGVELSEQFCASGVFDEGLLGGRSVFNDAYLASATHQDERERCQ